MPTETPHHYALPHFYTFLLKRRTPLKGQLGVPLTVYPWYLLCSTLGFLGIITHKYPLYKAYMGISHRGALVEVHPTIPWSTILRPQKEPMLDSMSSIWSICSPFQQKRLSCFFMVFAGWDEASKGKKEVTWSERKGFVQENNNTPRYRAPVRQSPVRQVWKESVYSLLVKVFSGCVPVQCVETTLDFAMNGVFGHFEGSEASQVPHG